MRGVSAPRASRTTPVQARAGAGRAEACRKRRPREVAEQALALALPNRVEAAYRRGEMLEKRRRLMEEWAAFCG